MKKTLVMLLAVLSALTLCFGAVAEEAAPMTHEEYVAAEVDSEVYVETYVQATQSWGDNKITVYCQREDGAYFI